MKDINEIPIIVHDSIVWATRRSSRLNLHVGYVVKHNRVNDKIQVKRQKDGYLVWLTPKARCMVVERSYIQDV